MKKIIFSFLGLILFAGILALMVSAQSNPAGNTSLGQLVALESEFDFETISMADGDVSHVFSVKNEGPDPVKISKVYTSCMCTSSRITDSGGKEYGPFSMPGHGFPSRTSVEVAPGQTVTVEAIFDPAAHGPSGVGLAERSIYLETNSDSSPSLELTFRAMVTQ